MEAGSETPITLWSLTLLTLTPFARFENWRISWEGSTFCEKVGKRLESGAIDMPQVCEGCTSETKKKLLVERVAFFANWAVGVPTGKRTDGGTERREEEAPTAQCEKAATVEICNRKHQKRRPGQPGVRRSSFCNELVIEKQWKRGPGQPGARRRHFRIEFVLEKQ